MSIARITDNGGSTVEEERSSIPIPGLAVAGLIAAGVVAFIRRRERISGHGDEVPDALREDVGLPRRYHEPRGWWEWR